MCWVGGLVLQGAHFGERKPSTARLYQDAPYGVNIPVLKNIMKHDAAAFVRRYIHFCDNDQKKPEGSKGYDRLFKISYALDTMTNGIRKAWIAGQRVTIDESMIKYMGRAVPFIQYMPAKPIKHSKKVFCLCCAYSGVLLAYQIYLGMSTCWNFPMFVSQCTNLSFFLLTRPGKNHEETKSTALSVCEALCDDAGLLEACGRVLYTDNYYTSVKLSRHMFEKYSWATLGTFVPTEKKHRENDDFPFHKLSNGARNSVGRGWFREAVIKLKAPSGTVYYI